MTTDRPATGNTGPHEPAPDSASTATPTASAYPLPEPGDDPRFTFGLLADLADVLTDHDYPPPQPRDLVHLLQLLFRFLYRGPDDTSTARLHH